MAARAALALIPWANIDPQFVSHDHPLVAVCKVSSLHLWSFFKNGWGPRVTASLASFCIPSIKGTTNLIVLSMINAKAPSCRLMARSSEALRELGAQLQSIQRFSLIFTAGFTSAPGLQGLQARADVENEGAATPAQV